MALKLSFPSQYKDIVPCHVMAFVRESGKTPDENSILSWLTIWDFMSYCQDHCTPASFLLPIFLKIVNAHTFIVL